MSDSEYELVVHTDDGERYVIRGRGPESKALEEAKSIGLEGFSDELSNKMWTHVYYPPARVKKILISVRGDQGYLDY